MTGPEAVIFRDAERGGQVVGTLQLTLRMCACGGPCPQWPVRAATRGG